MSKKVTKSEFARMAGVSAAAVGKAIKTNRLDIIGEGRKAKIDPECYKSVKYLKGMEKQRKGQGRPGKIKPTVKPKPAKLQTRKPKPKKDKKIIDIHRGEKQPKKEIQSNKIILLPKTGPKAEAEIPEPSEEDLIRKKEIQDLESLGQRYDVARTEKIEEEATNKKLANARIRGELVDREKVYNNLFMYLDKLHSNIERLADSFLSDIGPLIADAGKVMPEHRESWKDEVLSQIDESKKGIVEMLKKIEKEQSK